MNCKYLVLSAALAFASLPAQAGAISLGSANGFGLLGGTGVTNTGLSIVTDGDVMRRPHLGRAGL